MKAANRLRRVAPIADFAPAESPRICCGACCVYTNRQLLPVSCYREKFVTLQLSTLQHNLPIGGMRGGGRSSPMLASERSSGTLHSEVDFVTERCKVDGLGEKRLSAILQRLTLRFRIAISGDHDDRDVWP